MREMHGFSVLFENELTCNPFKMLSRDWALLTAGTQEKFNAMTIAWGGLGVLWEKKVCFVFVRPTRYTFEFMEQSDFFSISFFGEKYRQALSHCGSVSGRTENKIKKAGLTPIFGDHGIWYKEAGLVITCRKIYYQDIDPSHFLDPGIAKLYNGDYHRMYTGEISSILTKEF